MKIKVSASLLACDKNKIIEEVTGEDNLREILPLFETKEFI